MLTFLHIENVALIKLLDVDFTSGFTVMTGETGSGKSMIIDSINIVLGERPPKDIIRHGESECYIYALFDINDKKTVNELSLVGITPDEDGVLMLSRRYNTDGKSVFKINNRTVPVSIVRTVASYLISVNEQHDAHSLLNESEHIGYLDAYTSSIIPSHAQNLTDYRKALDEYEESRRKYNEHIKNAADRESKLEFLKYQKKEIASAKLKPDEENELLTLKETIKNSELIVNAVKGSLTLLSGGNKPGAYDKISSSCDNIEKIKDIITDGEVIYTKLNGIISDLDDVIKMINSVDTGAVGDPTAELDRIESRLDLISRLENKYGETVDDVLQHLENISNQISELEQYEFTLAENKQNLDESLSKALNLAKILHSEREVGAQKLTDAIKNELDFLDMEKVMFKVEFTPCDEPCDTGTEKIVFFVQTNSGEPFKSLSTVSSGGELSRIMLALKTVLSECEGVDSIIFDEIDTGVSGKTSSKIGISLKTLSKSRQVICITHSAQVSAIADNHFKISKQEIDGRTFTVLKELNYEERLQEIARILGGVTITESVIKTAEELIQQGKNN